MEIIVLNLLASFPFGADPPSADKLVTALGVCVSITFYLFDGGQVFTVLVLELLDE